MKIPVNVRFMRFVDRRTTEECWPWRGHRRSRFGYGHFSTDGTKTHLAHRYAYELLRDPIPVGLTIDHICRNQWCVNPFHMEPVTMAENNARSFSPSGLNARKTFCKRGHRLEGENVGVWVQPNGKPLRHCRTCKRAAWKEHTKRRALRKAEAAAALRGESK